MKPRANDVHTGDKFGHWTVLSEPQTVDGKTRVYCRCDCGKEKYVDRTNLIKGISRSCGCFRWERRSHIEMPAGLSSHRIYKIWHGMMDRCYNSKTNQYYRYGGRGITVCDEWRNSMTAFYNWAMANGYQSYLTLDRINNDGNYCPENCRWATPEQQSNNTRSNHNLTYNGKTQTVTQWAKELDIPRSTIYNRLCKGWDDVKALTYDGQPSRPNKRKEVKPLCGLRRENS